MWSPNASDDNYRMNQLNTVDPEKKNLGDRTGWYSLVEIIHSIINHKSAFT